jgi:hypothetical protein
VIRVRIARPTDRLDEVVRFYRDGRSISIPDPDGWRVVLDRGLAES